MGEESGGVDADEIVSAVCQWYGYSLKELENELTYDQVNRLYRDAVKRQQLLCAIQAEMNYQAMVVAISSVFNKAYGGSEEVPEKLGLLDSLLKTETDPPPVKTLRHYIDGAPDVLSIF